MAEVLDIKKEVLSLKANERMICFTGFSVRTEEGEEGKEGFLKISAFHRPRGSSYLTLTFIIDTDKDTTMKPYFSNLFERLDEESLRPYLGPEMQMIVKIPIEYEEIQDWYIQEVNLYFSSLQGREGTLVEKGIIPALETLLPCSFEPLEWWTGGKGMGKPPPMLRPEELSTRHPVRRFFRRWLGSGET